MEHRQSFWENLVVVAIALVLIQTFLDDFAVVAGWAWAPREVLLYVGLALDVFFSVEFLTRLYFSFIRRRTGIYFWHERGWIDLLASLPLVLLSSGPAALAVWSGSTIALGRASLLNVLKVVKAIRIARVLRLLRLLKVFARIRNTDSTMAQRHVAKVATLSVTVLIATVMLLGIVFSVFDVPSLETAYQSRITTLLSTVEADLDRGAPIDAGELAARESSLLAVQREGRTVFSRFDSDYYARQVGPNDYGFAERGDVRLFFDLRPVNRDQSRSNLIYFAIIVVTIGSLLFAYSPHFALTVTDPLHVMTRGITEANYSLEVKVPRLYRDDEVFELARAYNEHYLPLKDRRSAASADGFDLSMDDVQGLLDD